jgi:tape measure domain-containing protein
MNKLRSELRGLHSTLGDVRKQSKNTFDGMKEDGGGVSSAFAGGLVGGFAATFGSAIVGMGKQAIGTSMQIEQLNTKFAVFTGSADKAAQHVENLKMMGAKTPFEFTDLAEASTTLQAFGRSSQQAEKDLATLGDISGGNAEKLKSLSLVFGQVASAGRLTGGDLMQLINAGFNPLQEMSKKTGKSMSELNEDMEKGNISFKMMEDAMTSATSKGGQFYGMMDKQSQTLGGQLSTFQDAVSSSLAGMAEGLMPVLKFFVETGGKVLGLFDELPGPVKTVVGVLGLLTAAITLGSAAASSDMVIKGKQIVVEGALKTAKLLGLVTQNAETGAYSAGIVVRGLMTAGTWAMTVAQGALNAVMAANPIALVALAVAGLVAGLVVLYNNSEGVRKAIDGIWNVLKATGSFIKTFITTYIDGLTGALGGVVDVISGLFTLDFDKALAGAKKVAKSVGDAYGKSAIDGAKAFSSSMAKSEQAQKKVEKSTKDTNKALADQKAAGVAAGAANAEAQKKAMKAAEDHRKEIARLNDEFKKQGEGLNSDLDNMRTQYQRAQEDFRAGKITKAELDNAEKMAVKAGQWRVKNMHQREKDAKRIDELWGLNTDKAEKGSKTFLETIQAFIKKEQLLEETNVQTYAVTAKNLEAKLGLLETERAAKEANIRNEIKDGEKLKAALAKLATDRYEAEVALREAAAAEYEKEAAARAKANLTEVKDDMAVRLAEIKKGYDDQNKAVKELVTKKVITEQEANDAIALHERQRQVDSFKATRDFYQQKLGVTLNGLKTEFEATQKGAEALSGPAMFAVQMSNLRNYQRERVAAINKNVETERTAAKATITDAVKLREQLALIDKEASIQKTELARETAEQLKQLELSRIDAAEQLAKREEEYSLMLRGIKEDDIDFTLAMMDIEQEAERKRLRAQYTDNAEYQKAVALLEGKYSKAREGAIKDETRKNNVLYQTAAKTMESAFKKAADFVTASVSKMFGKMKEEAKGASQVDQQLAELDKNKRIAELAEQVRQNEISYEEFTLQKAKLEQDFTNSKKAEDDKQLSFFEEFQEIATSVLVDALSKRGQAYLDEALVEIGSEQAAASSNFITSVFSTMPWFLALPIIAAGLAGIGALFSSIMPKGFKKGGWTGDGDPNKVAGVTHSEEVVINRESSKKYGIDRLLYINKYGEDPPGYKAGGKVGPDTDHGDSESLHLIADVSDSVTAGKKFNPADILRSYSLKLIADVSDSVTAGKGLSHWKTNPYTQGVFEKLQANRGIVPQVNPSLTSSSSQVNAQLAATLKQTHGVLTALMPILDGLYTDGISVDPLTASGETLEAALRVNRKKVKQAAFAIGGGLG